MANSPKVKVLPALLFLLLPLFLVSCVSTSILTPMSSREVRRMAGVWNTQSGAVLTLNSDGSFRLDTEGKSLARGYFEAHGERVAFKNRGSRIPECDRTAGVYRFKLDRGTLFLRAIHDSCVERRAKLNALWRTP